MAISILRAEFIFVKKDFLLVLLPIISSLVPH
ncbi:hypothetical protein CUP1706 [Campylobacter upsaliensis RM3195]|nr:hypothetical protein CUP1706 [Campylobacter upsaliensis RM3195]